MDEREKYLEYQEGKRQAEASGINALTRDMELTAQSVSRGAKDALDRSVDDLDRDISDGANKIGKDIKDTGVGIKDEVKQDVGIGNAQSTRFDAAASGKGLTDNIKEPDKDDEIYVSRKRARYQ